jgi:hypothetical protein
MGEPATMNTADATVIFFVLMLAGTLLVMQALAIFPRH